MAGIVIALLAALYLLLQSGSPTPVAFFAAIAMFACGMGIINPLGTAIALEPFADDAGAASALLGFLQMALAALGTGMVSILPLDDVTALATVMLAGCGMACIVFLPALRTR